MIETLEGSKIDGHNIFLCSIEQNKPNEALKEWMFNGCELKGV